LHDPLSHAQEGKLMDTYYDQPTWPKLMHTTLSSLASHFESSYYKLIYEQVSQDYPRQCGTLPLVILKTTTTPHILQKDK